MEEESALLRTQPRVSTGRRGRKSRAGGGDRGKRTFWLPLTLLGAVFLTVVFGENILFYACRPPPAAVPPAVEKRFDAYSSAKKRLERRYARALETFLGAPAPAPSAGQEDPGSKAARPDPCAPGPPECPTPLPEETAAVRPEPPDPGPAAFAWPVSMLREPEPALPEAMRFMDWGEFRTELSSDLRRRCRGDPLADIGDSILVTPELVLDGLFLCIGGLSGRSEVRALEEEEKRSMSARLFDVQFAPREERLTAVFVRQWAESEKKYLGNFEDSRVNTFGFQNRTEDADLEELALDQRKVFWDALRRTYLARYKVSSEERFREESWYFDRWSGLDFALLPPFIAGYLYYRGLDKRIPMGPVALRVSFEPVSELRRRNHDLPVAAALEGTVKGFPVGIIVSAGIYRDRYGLDFAGIGTSIGAARSAVQGTQEERNR